VLSVESVDEAVGAESEWETVGDSGSTFNRGVIAAAVSQFIVIYLVETD
jgi:hypothetical protein